MATSGYTSVAVTNWDTLKFSWWENSQSTANNTTTIGWKMELIAGGSGRIDSSISKTWSVVVNGTTYSGTNMINIANNATKTLASGTTTIAHNSDGTKTFSYSFTQQIKINFAGEYISSKSGSGTGTLDTIARWASLTSVPSSWNDEGNPTIKYSNPAGNNVTKLEVCISLTGANDDVAYRSVSKTGTSYTFNLTTAERDVLRTATTGSNSRTVRFYVQTTIGDEVKRNYLASTFTVINALPTLSPSAVDTGTYSTAFTGDPSGTVIKYYNSMQVSTGSTAKKGATIVKQSVTCGGKSISTASGKLGNVDSGTFVFSVTDSRGNTVSQTLTKNLINYIKPTCWFSVAPPNPDTGIADITISGNYFDGSFGAVDNELSVAYRWRAIDTTYGEEWINTTPVITTGKYEVKTSMAIPNFDYMKTYYFQVKVADKVDIYEIVTQEYSVKTMPVFDWSETDFRVHGDFEVDNHAVLRGGLEVSGDVSVYGDTLVDGELSVGRHLIANDSFEVCGDIIAHDLAANSDLNYIFTLNRYTLLSVGSANYKNCPITSGTGVLEVVAGGSGGQRRQIVTSCSKTNPVRYERDYYTSSWGEWICTYYNGNKVLWGGSVTSGMYMTAGHTINFTEPASAQRHGIVLVFSYYNGTGDTNWNWQYFFVPKYLINDDSSGQTFHLTRSKFAAVGTKYLYIRDTHIVGHDDNNLTGTANGITYANNKFVLRYVLGV